ncbi:MAG TPA: LLM class flavin-dependent oxidoreductase, partial [Candidatus Sphingobacterium stercoripullorum]|nr:LLM class flavin-dependent oxidoreductase [Candidatus Sphingobacterium stercoripullorum]
MKEFKVSLLELAAVIKGGDFKSAIDDAVLAAQKVEELGFQRVWLAEHHNMEFIASSATAVLIGHIAQQTKQIRIGSGGIMLPNHSPLVVAEKF